MQPTGTQACLESEGRVGSVSASVRGLVDGEKRDAVDAQHRPGHTPVV